MHRSLRIAIVVAFISTLTSGPVTAVRSAPFPGSQPQLAALGQRVYLAFGSDNTISVARSEDAGETFGAATRLASSGRLSLGMHRGPRVAATASALLVSAVIGAKGGGADGDVVLYRSNDQGASWAPPVVINDVTGSAREGLHAMAANPSGLVVLAWLDLRDKGTRIYAAVSRDHGATWAADALVYSSPSGSVCECCHPSVAISAQGQIAVMFRNNLDGNRDMYVARAAADARFGPPTKVGTESWLLNACPMDGGGISFAADGLVAAWRRNTSVLVSTSQVSERNLDAGRDPAIAAVGSHVDIAWSSKAGIQLARDGGPSTLIGPGGFPALLAFPEKTVVAFEHQGTVAVRALRR
jgi:hypothetical protein